MKKFLMQFYAVQLYKGFWAEVTVKAIIVITCYKVVLNVVWIIKHTPKLLEHVFFVFKHVLLHNPAAYFIQPTDFVFISLLLKITW